MVTWGRSFKAALLFLAFSIVWLLIGGAIIIVGSISGLLGIVQYVPYPPYVTINWGALGGMIIVFIIGYLIIYLGILATFFKVFAELLAEEMRKYIPATTVVPTAPTASASTPTCPRCGTPLTYVQQYQRWYCPNCKEYQ